MTNRLNRGIPRIPHADQKAAAVRMRSKVPAVPDCSTASQPTKSNKELIMSAVLPNLSARDAVVADIPYTLDSGEKLVNETFGAGDVSRRRTGAVDQRAMRIANGRL